MRILITGGAGYIGSTLSPQLLQSGHEVTVLDSLMYEQTPLLDQFANTNFRFVKGDVRDHSLVKELLQGQDAILPLACLTGAPICDQDPSTAKDVNFEAVKFIADNKSSSQMMIYPCTNSGYGVGESGVHCDENSPLRPVSLYGKLKVDLESYLLERKDSVTFRFATLFGMSPRMRLDLLVNDFVYRAVKDRTLVLFEAHFKRNYLHVRDAANAFEHTLNNYEQMISKAHNVGLSDANLSKAELCEAIQKHVPNFQFFSSNIGKDPDQRNYIVSNKRIEDTGFKTQYSLDDGIRELVAGYQIIHRKQFANV